MLEIICEDPVSSGGQIEAKMDGQYCCVHQIMDILKWLNTFIKVEGIIDFMMYA